MLRDRNRAAGHGRVARDPTRGSTRRKGGRLLSCETSGVGGEAQHYLLGREAGDEVGCTSHT